MPPQALNALPRTYMIMVLRTVALVLKTKQNKNKKPYVKVGLHVLVVGLWEVTNIIYAETGSYRSFGQCDISVVNHAEKKLYSDFDTCSSLTTIEDIDNSVKMVSLC